MGHVEPHVPEPLDGKTRGRRHRMIIDAHGHYTTAPKQLREWRERQIASAGTPFTEKLVISDDEIRESIVNGQLRLQEERGTAVALLSPIAGMMAHHYGDEETSRQW